MRVFWSVILVSLAILFACRSQGESTPKTSQRELSIKNVGDFQGHMGFDGILSKVFKANWKQVKDKYNRPTNQLISPSVTYKSILTLLNVDQNDLRQNTIKMGEYSLFGDFPDVVLAIYFTEEEESIKGTSMCTAVLTIKSGQALVDSRLERMINFPSILIDEDYSGDAISSGIWESTSHWKKSKYLTVTYMATSPKMKYSNLQEMFNFKHNNLVVNHSKNGVVGAYNSKDFYFYILGDTSAQNDDLDELVVNAVICDKESLEYIFKINGNYPEDVRLDLFE